MALTFNKITGQQKSRSRILWTGLLFCWLFIANVATAHQQKHLLDNEFECHYCVSSFNNTPVIAADLLNISEASKLKFVFNPPQYTFHFIQAIELNSRGPPFN